MATKSKAWYHARASAPTLRVLARSVPLSEVSIPEAQAILPVNTKMLDLTRLPNARGSFPRFCPCLCQADRKPCLGTLTSSSVSIGGTPTVTQSSCASARPKVMLTALLQGGPGVTRIDWDELRSLALNETAYGHALGAALSADQAVQGAFDQSRAAAESARCGCCGYGC